MNPNIDAEQSSQREMDEAMEVVQFAGEMSVIAKAIEMKIEPLGNTEYEDTLQYCINKLIHTDDQDMVTVAFRMINLIIRRRQGEFAFNYETLDIEEYVRDIWKLVKQWIGIGVGVRRIPYSSLVAEFERLHCFLSFLVSYKVTQWTVNEWTEKILEITTEREDSDVDEETVQNNAEEQLLTEEFSNMTFLEQIDYKTKMFAQKPTVVDHTKYTIFYSANLAFHMWQKCLLQDMYISKDAIDTFIKPPARELYVNDENGAFVSGAHHFVRLALASPIAKDVRTYLIDNWLSELWLPGLRGTSTNSVSIVSTSIWKRALPAETTNLITRIKECKMDALWCSLNGDGAYDLCLRYTIARYVLELTFSKYIADRLLRISPVKTAGDKDIFSHFAWFGMRARACYANGWDALFLVMYEWLRDAGDDPFHVSFINTISALTAGSERLPVASTAGELSVRDLPPYYVIPNNRKKQRLLRERH